MGILTNISLFSGAGGLDLGAKIVGGFKTICYVENNRYAQGVLVSRMRDGGLDEAPIWDDVQSFRGSHFRGLVDCVSGGFPCQDLSVAGKRAGIEAGARSGLWREFARIIREVGPRFVLVENVPGLLAHPGLGVVLGDLAEMGFDAEWFVLSAAAVGAPHLRERVWVVAYTQGSRTGLETGILSEQGRWSSQTWAKSVQQKNWNEHDLGSRTSCETLADTKSISAGRLPEREKSSHARPGISGEDVADSSGQRCGEKGTDLERSKERSASSGDVENTKGDGRKQWGPERKGQEWLSASLESSWWSVEPNVGRVAHGVASRVDRLRCLGNGVVPQQSAAAWQKIKDMAHMIYK